MSETEVFEIERDVGLSWDKESLSPEDTGVYELSSTDAQLALSLSRRTVEPRLTEVTLVRSSRFGGVYRAKYQPQRGRIRRPVVLRVFSTPQPEPKTANILLTAYLTALDTFGRRSFPELVDQRRYGDRTVVATEFIEGQTATAYLRRPLSVRSFITIQRRISENLRQMHARDVLHLDLKPDNLLVAARDRRVYCVDVGAWYEPVNGRRLGVLVGSRSYVAPEVIKAGVRPGKLFDVYSFGVSLLHSLLLNQPGWQYQEILAVPKLRAKLQRAADVCDTPVAKLFTLALECAADDPSRRPNSFGCILRNLIEIRASDAPIHVETCGFLRRVERRAPRIRGETVPGTLNMRRERITPSVGLAAAILLAVVGLYLSSPPAMVYSLLFVCCAIVCEVARGVAAKRLSGSWNARLLRHTSQGTATSG